MPLCEEEVGAQCVCVRVCINLLLSLSLHLPFSFCLRSLSFF
jgi:hypothetical protein